MRPLSLVLLILAACASVNTTWDRLSDNDAVWVRCQQRVADRNCGVLTINSDLNARGNCVLNLVGEYRSRATFTDQRQWLQTNGCPAMLVSPEQVIVDGHAREQYEVEHPDAGPPSGAPLTAPAPPSHPQRP